MSANPFEAIDARLSSIEEILLSFSKSNYSPPTKEEEDLVPFKEAAKILHLSPDRLYVIHKKIFPTRRSGKGLLFKRKDLYDFINGKKVNGII